MPNAVFASAGKVMVLAPLVTLNARTTGAAAATVALPACDAVIEQVPTETSVMTPAPVAVQTAVVVEA